MTQERTEVNDAQAKSATSSKVTASAACKPNLKSAKVLSHVMLPEAVTKSSSFDIILKMI